MNKNDEIEKIFYNVFNLFKRIDFLMKIIWKYVGKIYLITFRDRSLYQLLYIYIFMYIYIYIRRDYENVKINFFSNRLKLLRAWKKRNFEIVLKKGSRKIRVNTKDRRQAETDE